MKESFAGKNGQGKSILNCDRGIPLARSPLNQVRLVSTSINLEVSRHFTIALIYRAVLKHGRRRTVWPVIHKTDLFGAYFPSTVKSHDWPMKSSFGTHH
jgi:hypothetical protein